jgi:hypothetical protein
MYDVMMRGWPKPGIKPQKVKKGPNKGKKKQESKTQASKGSLRDRFFAAFNITAWSLTESKRLRPRTLDLTGIGLKREKEVEKLQDSKVKLRWISKCAAKLMAQDPEFYEKTWWDAMGRHPPP